MEFGRQGVDRKWRQCTVCHIQVAKGRVAISNRTMFSCQGPHPLFNARGAQGGVIEPEMRRDRPDRIVHGPQALPGNRRLRGRGTDRPAWRRRCRGTWLRRCEITLNFTSLLANCESLCYTHVQVISTKFAFLAT